VGRIPPHRTDAGTYLLAECFGCATVTLIKDVDGLYESDPKVSPCAGFIEDITVAELKERNLPTLPFDCVLTDLLASARQATRFQVMNGLKPHLLQCPERRARRHDRPQRRAIVSPQALPLATSARNGVDELRPARRRRARVTIKATDVMIAPGH
jgi:hypothetical protein